jgi:hypothetical protein
VGGGTFSRDAKPPGLDIWWRVDRLSTYGPVLSCQAFNAAAPRGPDPDDAYSVLEAPGHGYRELGRVQSRVMRMDRNWRPSVPWV